MPRIRLSPTLSTITTTAGLVFHSDLGTFRLYGPDLQMFIDAVVPLLDGSRGMDEVVESLPDYSPESVRKLLDLLERHGVIETVGVTKDERWRGQEEFFRTWTDHPQEATQALSRARVLLAGLEPWGAVAAAELAASGVGALHVLDDGRVTEYDLLSVRFWGARHVGRPRVETLKDVLGEISPWCRVTTGSFALNDDRTLALRTPDWDLVMGTLAREELQVLRSLAEFSHRSRIPSLYGYLEGLDAVVGPVVIPGQTACWNCARLRRLAHADHPEVAHALHASLAAARSRPRVRTYLAPMVPVLGHLIALEALKLLSQYAESRLAGCLLVQNLVTLETSLHTIIRMPWCDICGGAKADGPPPGGAAIDPGSDGTSEDPSSHGLDGIDDPGELRARLVGWVDSRVGVIKTLTREYPSATEPEWPVTCGAALATYTDGVYVPQEPVVGAGKGFTLTEAMIGATAEAIERYSAARYRGADLHRSSLTELQGDVLDPRCLCLYDDEQYGQPDFPFARFDPDRPMSWTKGSWLDTGMPVWVPALPTYFHFQAPPAERFCQVTSNGLAAGATLEVASLRAVLELVERDAFMITWLTRRPGRSLLLDDTLEAGTGEVVRQLRERGVGIELFLIDAGLAIPVVICVGRGDGKWWPGITLGLGADLNPRTAVRKAILEHSQIGAHICRLMGDAECPIPNTSEDVRTPTDHALYYVLPERARLLDFLRPDGDPPISLSVLPNSEGSLRACAERLQAAGVRIVLVNVTAPDVSCSAFRVVRALGVDMQPIYFGFTLRRLATPRLKTMMRKGLNPHPHPFA